MAIDISKSMLDEIVGEIVKYVDKESGVKFEYIRAIHTTNCYILAPTAPLRRDNVQFEYRFVGDTMSQFIGRCISLLVDENFERNTWDLPYRILKDANSFKATLDRRHY
jgi:hypothetical protein